MEINGKKLKDIRLSNGLTQETLATKAGVTPRTVQRAESGFVGPTSIRRIAKELGLEVHDFCVALPADIQPESLPLSSDKDDEELLLYLLDQEELRRATNPHQKGHPVWFRNDQLKNDLGWSVGRINDVVELVEQNGWVFLSDEIPGSNFNFVSGYLTAQGKIFADPTRRNDPKLLLRFLANYGEGEEKGYQKLSVPEISTGLSWDMLRTEDAIEVLEDRGQVTASTGIVPPSYHNVKLTAQGRKDARK